MNRTSGNRRHHLTLSILLTLGLGIGAAQADASLAARDGTDAPATGLAGEQRSGDEIWQGLGREFTRLYEQGRFEAALEVARHAHALALNIFGPDHVNTADSLLKLGIAHQALNQLPAARDNFEQSLRLLLGRLGREAPELAAVFTNLGNIHVQLGDLDAAEAAHRKALGLRSLAFGEDSAEAAQSMYNLAVLLEQRGEYARAAAQYRRVVEIWSATLGEDHPFVGTALRRLVRAYTADQRPDDAAATELRLARLTR